ncbi:MAG TPA: murein biosynthesis integral membrane protein MurJ [Chlamydiales bacterium]|nr:murein biosynthesis integral membrane protein MurJ [Chlamydiales bacterium]
MDSSQLVIRFAKRFFAGTLLSRISGAFRDIAMAICFGSAPEIGAFMVAYRFANLFRRLLGDGSLQAGFIPHFSSLQEKESLYFYRDCTFSLTSFLLFIILCLEGILWGISHFFSNDWKAIISLSMRMLPGLLFICLYALNSAFLQTQKKYFLSGFAPVLFNLCWIIAALFASFLPLNKAMEFLSFGITIAFILQWAVTLLQTRQFVSLSWGEWLRPQIFSLELKKMIKPISLGVIGVGATQLNSALDAIFSRISDLSGPAYLWYAIRVEQLPLALFGIALSGALLPPLSRAIVDGAIDRYSALLNKALHASAILIVPCTFGLLALGGPGLNLLYGHGDFSPLDVQQTLYCLWGYGLGLLPSVMILLMASSFYAKKTYTVPTIASLTSVVFHTVLTSFLVFGLHLGAFSIAISTSIAAFVNCSVLVYYSKINLHLDLWKFFGRIIFCGLSAAIATIYVGYAFLGDVTFTDATFTRSFSRQCMQLLCMGSLFCSVFVGSCYALGIRWNQKEQELV